MSSPTSASIEFAMIEFVTLFLGALFVGIRPVEVMVEPSVAAVELHLDGRAVARMVKEPWRAEIDFGSELAPHLLEGVAFDSLGREADRTRQWINMSSHQVEATIMLEPGLGGVGTIARVSWESISEEREPADFSATFDDQPLAAENPRKIPLPEFDPDEPHHLRVELEFAGSLTSTAEATFGGVFGDEVSTELTATVIELQNRKTQLAAKDVEGWFLIGAEPLAVRAVETGVAEIVVVKDVAAQPILDQLENDRRTASQFKASARAGAPTAEFAGSAHLRKDHRLRVVGSCPGPAPRGDSEFTVFPMWQEIGPTPGGLIRLVSEFRAEECFPEEQMLTDAVAVAGLAATNSGRRRTVVLITTQRPSDRSNFRPGQVKRYLERLHVPFEVWSVDKQVDHVTRWGDAIDVSSPRRLGKAYGRLSKRLDHHRVVWLDGLHLPQSIRLQPGVKGVRLVE